MPRYPEEFLTKLKENIDIVDFVSDYVDLKRSGRYYKGLCPFHSEKSPSFFVYPETQSYFCFGCQKGGDLINFTEGIERLDYVEAVKFLAQRAGLPIPEEEQDDTSYQLRKRMREMNRDAARYFYRCLRSSAGEEGMRYWREKRGLSMETIRHFGLGYAPDDWHGLQLHMRSLGYSDEELRTANLVRRSERNGRINYYDNFRGRVMVPIIDLRGNIIAFGGRVLDDSKPKYVNTSDTLIYSKTDNVFALNFAKDTGKDELILCEGYMDVIALHQAGFTNAVAGLGTALTDVQARLIARYCNLVYLSYDSDEAGRKATERAIDRFEHNGVAVRVLSYTGSDGKDPDEVIRNHGAERFRSLLKDSEDAEAYRIGEKRKLHDLTSDDGKYAYLKDAVPVVAGQEPIRQELSISALANETGIPAEAIRAQVREQEQSNQRRRHYREKREAGSFHQLNRAADGKTRKQHAEQTILQALLNNPDYLERVDRELDPEDFSEGFERNFYLALRERIQEGKSIDLIQFSEILTPEQMSELTRPPAEGMLPNTTSKEVEDCIRVLKNSRRRTSAEEAGNLSDDEFRRFINQHKKKGT